MTKAQAQSPCPFILVDGSSYLFRAYHALPPLVNSQGQATGAIYGVINMLKKLIQTVNPSHMAVVFDTKEKTFRHDMYAEYKANRPDMPEELASQIKPLHEVIEAMGMPLIAVPGFEADDVVATLAYQAKAEGFSVLISTGDKDFAQIVDPAIRLVNTMSDELMDEQMVAKKFGVKPAQVIDYLALVGDSVDNVPGIPKVGPKTAAKWLTIYGNLDEIIAHRNEIKGKVGEYLRENLEQLRLSKELVTIRHDVELSVGAPDCVLRPQNVGLLRQWFTRLEFKTWLKSLDSLESTLDEPVRNGIEAPVFECLVEQQSLQQFCEALEVASVIAIDTETTSLSPHEAKLVGISLAIDGRPAVYVPIGHDYEDCPEQLSFEAVRELLCPILLDETKCFVGHNLKYDLQILKVAGLTIAGSLFDTMIASYVDNSIAGRHDLTSVAARILNIEASSYESVTKIGKTVLNFSQVPLASATQYAAEDAWIALGLYHHFQPKFAADEHLQSVFETIDMPLVSVLAEMEYVGVRLNSDLLRQQSIVLEEKTSLLEEQAIELAGETFNLNSPKQLQAILFEKLALPVLQKTPKGQPSTAESVLAELAHDYELPGIVLSYRSLVKLKTTYTDKLPEKVCAITGRVHASFNQAVTATGRLSSSEPNLQNIPVRTQEGRAIRQAFIPREGYKLVAADYSQIELRIMAHLSGDEGLVAAFKDKQDIHQTTASEIFNVSLDSVTSLQRRHAKAINFGLIYGMSAFGLAKQIDSDRKTAQAYMDHYFEKFPGVASFMQSIRTSASQKGFVETLFGRKLYLPDIMARNLARRKQAERAAINAPMQGTAADLIKKAMTMISDQLQSSPQDMFMIMQVHDELIFEVKNTLIDRSVEMIRTSMESAAQLDVPLVVDVGVGDNWDEAH